jgi:hypothetical protein
VVLKLDVEKAYDKVHWGFSSELFENQRFQLYLVCLDQKCA